MSQKQLVKLLQEKFGLSQNAIEVAMSRSVQITSLLPIALWQAGLITLDQLDTIWGDIEAAEGDKVALLE